MEVPQKTKNRITIQFSNSTSGYLSEGNKNANSKKDTCTPMFAAVLFTKAKTWKHPKCPRTDERKKKPYYLNTRTHEHTVQYYSAIRKRRKSCYLGQH